MSRTSDFTIYASCPSESMSSPDKALFLERLDTFMQKLLDDIKAFAERESRSYQEMRRSVAEWHAKFLFSAGGAGIEEDMMGEVAPEEKLVRVRNILIEASKVLESLADVSGVQSFLLAVDPNNPHDAGFLGGSLIGREYYRGLRGGGAAGAGSFKTYAQKRVPSSRDEADTQESSVRSSPAPPTLRSAKQTKVNLYETIRLQLRTVSGIRKAEMKWANPERLSLYGVRMIGWPSDIPAANPSSLKANQNQKLLELVEQGELRFEKTTITGLEAHDASQSTSDATADDFSWAYDAEGGRGAGVGRTYGTIAAAKSVPDAARSLSLVPSTLSGSGDILPVQENSQGSTFWRGNNGDLLTAEHNGSADFDEYGIHVEPWNDMVRFDEPDDDSPIEPRARKRARSMEESEGR